MNDIILKIGGKIIENPLNLKSTIFQLRELIINQKIINKIIIIPGGGSYANLIRSMDKKMDFDEDLSHWMAIYAMNTQGTKIINKFPEIEGINNIKPTKKSVNETKIFLFLPYEFLKQNDELPHSWDVTSDSITIFMANKIGLKECYLIKDIDGILDANNKVLREITPKRYKLLKNTKKLLDIQDSIISKKSSPIDYYSLDLIEKYKISCVILNGSEKKKSILKFFTNSEKSVYTRICSI